MMNRHKLITILFAALFASLVLLPAAVMAQPPLPAQTTMSQGQGVGESSRARIRDHYRRQQARRWGLGSHPGRHLGNGVPELDPRAGGAAVVLVLGGALVLTARRRRLAI